ncbi:MAG TPA: hypothetical protein VMR21_04665 [Vicinamibacteria bacterium]|nr:hypothetical protein [Vicinamibacteria bacterium]
MPSRSAGLSLCLVLASVPSARPDEVEPLFRRAAENGVRSEEVFRKTRRMMRAWLEYADPRTLLLPDHIPGYTRGTRPMDLYTPHNSGADNYPYLVATAFFTDRALYEGRLREMLRNEIRYTDTGRGIPGNLELKTGTLGPPSLFGAAEYAKDGLLAITELLGRTPWFYRMADMTAAVMEAGRVPSAYGPLPDAGAELNGDVLQSLVRLAAMTGDPRFLGWAHRIGDAYVEEVLPRNHGLPGYTWDFEKHEGPDRMRLRDHGNEIVVGLTLLHALESAHGRPRGERWRAPIGRMLDRILASANPDGLLYDDIRASDLVPTQTSLSDNWGYVYGSVYTHYMVTGEARYRDAVLKVLRNLPRYRGHDWERGSHDGYADAIESALYLVAREPVPEALDWIESEVKTLLAFQRPDGTIERWYGDGNWSRTLLLYAMMKTQGCFLDGWTEGVALGAVRDGERLLVSLQAPAGWKGRLRFDHARHRRVLNFDRDYVRLNEWPEWFTVDENRLYRVTDGTGTELVRLGSDLKDGIDVAGSGRWIVAPAR